MKLFKYRAVLPLLFIALAALLRLYLVIHGRGVLDGDEALVGIQAQHILQDEWHVYFYGIPYFGSLEAYLTALVFAVAGSSAWTLRIVPLVLSLVLVWLTWSLAQVLAKHASLSPKSSTCFACSAALVAACVPLYDAVLELRAWGGHIEIYVIMLGLLLASLRLVDRWQAGISMRELGLRSAVIGFLVGLGFWVYPLVVCAVAAAGLWILLGLVKIRPALKELSLALAAIPGLFLGFAPGIYWGATHFWQNITYILQQGSHESLSTRVHTIWHVAKYYRQCLAGRVIGGEMPVGSMIEHSIHVWLWYAGLFSAIATILIVVAAWTTRTPVLAKLSRAIALPLLFGLCSIAIFCASSASAIGLHYPCSQDFVGRYAAPIALALPFFIATTVTAVISLVSSKLAKIGIILLLLIYAGANIYSYRLSDSRYLFQSPYCLDAPVDNTALIAYLERNHIRHAWAMNFIGNPVTFETQSRVIAVDPLGALTHTAWLNRIPEYTEAVRRADRPSLILLVGHEDKHPQLLHMLDQEQITYRAARIPSASDLDVMVVTPTNRSVSWETLGEVAGDLFVCGK